MIENALKIDGWMSATELNWLALAASQCKSVVEVGSYKGRSARAIADNLDGTLYVVDPWKGPFLREDGSTEFIADDNLMNEFLKNMEGCKARLEVFRGDSSGFRAQFDGYVDLMLIDGCHLYPKVKEDILNALLIVRAGGVIACHDYLQPSWPGVKRAFDEIFRGSNPIIVDSIGFLIL